MSLSARNASYEIARDLRRGDIVEFTASVYFKRQIAVGECAEIVSVSNAGFRGMEAHVRFEDGSWANVSTGVLANLSR